MPNTQKPMKLSCEEEIFLRHWIYDEVHFREGVGPAKRLQVDRAVPPADLATLIAAALPSPREQEAAGVGPPPIEAPIWPWTAEAFKQRLAEADDILAKQRELASRQIKGKPQTPASAGR
jgi:hypothetical protein